MRRRAAMKIWITPDTVFIVGSNMAFAHPILFRRLEDAKRARPHMKIIVADPRRTETAELADLYLPLLPGTDVALFNSLLHVMLWEGLCDHAFIAAHTTGFETLRDRARDFTPKETAKLCGLPEADLIQAARWFAKGPEPVAVLPGSQSKQQRHGEECGLDQPAPGHGPHRQTRRRSLLVDGSAECDGRTRGRWHGELAVRPSRPGQRGPSR